MIPNRSLILLFRVIYSNILIVDHSKRVFMQFTEKIPFGEQWLFSIVFIMGISAFITLTVFMRNGQLTHFDHTGLYWFHKIKNSSFDRFFSLITWLGSLWVLLPLYVILTVFFSPFFENFEQLLGIGFWGTVITTYALKYEFQRKRPHLFLSLNELPIDPSFPSAHTAQIVAFSLLLWLIVYNGTSLFGILLTGILGLVTLGVASSRMYLQVHFPTDVLAGVLIGISWSCLSVLITMSGVIK